MTAAETLALLLNSTPLTERPALAADLARALAELFASAADAAAPKVTPRRDDPAGELLGIEEAAKRLHVSETWLYRHSRDLPFAKKLGRRTLRFDARGLENWARSRPA